MLSHYNIGSNIEQVKQVFGFTRFDRMLGILPFFHSFGFMGTLWLPAVLGIAVVYHPNPLDGKTIGPFVRDFNVTFLLSTPTLLQIYIRSCTPEQFGGLRVVIPARRNCPTALRPHLKTGSDYTRWKGTAVPNARLAWQRTNRIFDLRDTIRLAPSVGKSGILCRGSRYASSIRKA